MKKNNVKKKQEERNTAERNAERARREKNERDAHDFGDRSGHMRGDTYGAKASAVDHGEHERTAILGKSPSDQVILRKHLFKQDDNYVPKRKTN